MTRAALVLLLCVAAAPVHAAQLTSVSVLDQDYLVVQISDGDVTHNENPSSETVSRYTPVLNTSAAVSTASWTITSPQDGKLRRRRPAADERLPQDEAERPRPDGVDGQRLPLRIHLPALDLPQAAQPDAAGDDLHRDGRRGDQRHAHVRLRDLRHLQQPLGGGARQPRRLRRRRRPQGGRPLRVARQRRRARLLRRSRATRSTSTTWAPAWRRRSAS